MYGCKGWSSSFDWIFFIWKTTKSCSEWTRIWIADNQNWCSSGFSSWSIVFFYIYISDLSDTLESNVKLFADDTLMFSVVRDPINTSQKLNNDIDKVSLWANIWKMSFNPDPSKQAQDVIFSRKIKYITHLFYLIILPFNNYCIVFILYSG